ncbi:aminotransferase class I/II-fold pyridoxal phosphate-dependent enzyme [Polymorphobacter sp.]|uniref:aminotransferase class I/II-fold pyridoxal phosphate-dependent enzyme n=1 Tax=Polymorphobacter sp. TaxID=1909290 RepID=UPI003F70FB36
MPCAARLADFAVHGGRVAQARVVFPGERAWIDLSTGISPWAYPVAVDPATLALLPEPGALAALEAAAAAVFGVDPLGTVAVPGSDLAMRLLGPLLGAKAPAVIGPGYAGHLAIWPNAKVIQALMVDGHDAVVLARPNNPDGAILPLDALEAAADRLAARGGWLIVDEAFADASGAPSVAAAGRPGTIVLRSFGKFFGLAGLRLGFVLAPPALAKRLRHAIGDWPVSGPAIAIGTAAYRDHGWQAAQRRRLAEAAAALDALLDAAGLTGIGGTPCFRLVETQEAAGLFHHLASQAILTRPFADNGRRLRIGLPADAAARARLGDALRQWRPR